MKSVLLIVIGFLIGGATGAVITTNVRKEHPQRHTTDPNTCRMILPEYQVVITGLPARDNSTGENGKSKKIGYGTKLGGEPDWIQGVDIPICGECGQPMIFVAQIDSVAMADKTPHPAKDAKTGKALQEFMFGDAGMLYVFTCLDCGEVKGVGQCY